MAWLLWEGEGERRGERGGRRGREGEGERGREGEKKVEDTYVESVTKIFIPIAHHNPRDCKKERGLTNGY